MGRKGKIEVISTKPCQTADDLSLAYSPGVAEPCLAIEKNPEDAYKYTAKGNLVAVVSNGTAVLGLGNLGALAGKPVMEGKGILFKRFADIDVFDIELNTEDPDEIIKACQLLEPTFGGINLEDIKAPECFYIEEDPEEDHEHPGLPRRPARHRHHLLGRPASTPCMLVGKKIEDIRIVVNGAGAAANSCAKLAIALGVKPNNMIMCDTKGVIYKGRVEGMNPYKELFAADTHFRTLEEAAAGADVLFGLSAKGAFTKEMVASMAPNPIIFAMANPDPEITPEEAHAVRNDVIIATGRSDYPNQVNNVLGFPFIFRGALDVPRHLHQRRDEAGRGPRPGQPGPRRSARFGLQGLRQCQVRLRPRLHHPQAVRPARPAACCPGHRPGGHGDRRCPPADRRHGQIHRASGIDPGQIQRDHAHDHQQGQERSQNDRLSRRGQRKDPAGRPGPGGGRDRQADPDRRPKEDRAENWQNCNIELDVPIIDPADSELTEGYAEELYRPAPAQRADPLRMPRASCAASRAPISARMMVRMGDADALLGGIDTHYPETIRPALEVIGKQQGLSSVHGLYMMVFKKGVYFLADTTVTIDPTAEELAETAILAAEKVRMLDIEPRVAMLSFSNFGSVHHPQAKKVKRAVEIVKERAPELIVEGEMQADTAVVPELLNGFTFSKLKSTANVLIFPDLNSGNICYKLLHHLGGAEAIGPILMGMNKPVHVLQRGDSVDDIVNMAAIAVVDVQNL